nr:fused MFS/spermidine synthase [Pseudomonas sp.]
MSRAPSRSPRLLHLGLAAALAVMTTLSLCNAGTTDVLHTEPSEFSPIVVYENRGERCMNFGSLQAPGRQTCIDVDAPDRMVFGYTRMMMSALFIHPDPERILIIGLGGGTLPRALAQVLPQATIDTVEIDPAVVRVAERFFGFVQSPRQRVFVEDGRAFVEGVQARGGQYDMILLDAFDVDYIPPHLLTMEFLTQVRDILAPDGVLVANTFSESAVYDSESTTYASVFGEFFNLRHGNRVIMATKGPLPDTAQLLRNAKALQPELERFGIDVQQQLQLFSRRQDWDTNAPVLKDPPAGGS